MARNLIQTLAGQNVPAPAFGRERPHRATRVFTSWSGLDCSPQKRW